MFLEEIPTTQDMAFDCYIRDMTGLNYRHYNFKNVLLMKVML